MRLFFLTFGLVTGLLIGSCDYLKDESQCDTHCEKNADCAYLGGFCLSVETDFGVDKICSKKCSNLELCEDGFICSPLNINYEWNWQCLPWDLEVCE